MPPQAFGENRTGFLINVWGLGVGLDHSESVWKDFTHIQTFALGFALDCWVENN